MELQDRDYERAIDVARRFLLRWPDHFTRNAIDDIAQETAVEVWRCRDRLHGLERFEAFVRTVCRHMRCRMMRRQRHDRLVSLEDCPDLDWILAETVPSHERIVVAGRRIRTAWLAEQVEEVLARVPPVNRCLVREFYRGSSCLELAERYQLAPGSVKVRLFRSRRRIRKEFVGRAKRAFATV